MPLDDSFRHREITKGFGSLHAHVARLAKPIPATKFRPPMTHSLKLTRNGKFVSATLHPSRMDALKVARKKRAVKVTHDTSSAGHRTTNRHGYGFKTKAL